MFVDMGMTRDTAAKATDEIHRDENRALNFHLVQELGVDPREKPSPWVAAISSFVTFAVGAVTPLIPYLLGFESLWAGSDARRCGSDDRRWRRLPLYQEASVVGSLRQLAFGGVAIAATYVVGTLVGTVMT